MKPIVDKYLKIFNSTSINSSLWIIYSCFADLSFTFGKVPLIEIDDWIENSQNQKMKKLWAEQRNLKYPSMIFLFLMMDKKDRTLREQGYARNVIEYKAVKKLDYEEYVKIEEQLKEDVVFLPAFDSVDLLGELLGAWMLTCPEFIIRQNTDRAKNWQPTLPWLKEIYPDSLGKDIPPKELELLYILDYDVYYTFETIMCRNTV